MRLRINGHDVSKVLLDDKMDLSSARALLMRPAVETTDVPKTSATITPPPSVISSTTPTTASTVASHDVTMSRGGNSLVYPSAPTTTLVAYMSQFDSLESFYVQPVDRLDALTTLAESLNGRYKRDDATEHRLPTSVNKGDVVCARWTEDDHWYRARIKEIQENIVRVIGYRLLWHMFRLNVENDA